jgi:hypothetical protein
MEQLFHLYPTVWEAIAAFVSGFVAVFSMPPWWTGVSKLKHCRRKVDISKSNNKQNEEDLNNYTGSSNMHMNLFPRPSWSLQIETK